MQLGGELYPAAAVCQMCGEGRNRWEAWDRKGNSFHGLVMRASKVVVVDGGQLR